MSGAQPLKKYITKICPLEKFEDLKEKHPHSDNRTPVIQVKMVYPNTNPKDDDEHIIWAKNRLSAWSQARKLARRIAKSHMDVHKDYPIGLIELS